ncbi:MAG: protein-disulfide reductase DsbD domain-containing protein [Chitinophagaceae bacterium]
MRFIIALLLLICSHLGFAQIKDPVQWQFNIVKKSADTYEVVIIATLPKPWHIYSQNTPAGGPIPTSIVFKPNPLISLVGKPKEIGKLQTEHDKNFGVDVKHYANEVTFIQIVKLKGKVKTNINGVVEYMVCDDHQCLPPTKKNFTLALQ